LIPFAIDDKALNLKAWMTLRLKYEKILLLFFTGSIVALYFIIYRAFTPFIERSFVEAYVISSCGRNESWNSSSSI